MSYLVDTEWVILTTYIAAFSRIWEEELAIMRGEEQFSDWRDPEGVWAGKAYKELLDEWYKLDNNLKVPLSAAAQRSVRVCGRRQIGSQCCSGRTDPLRQTRFTRHCYLDQWGEHCSHRKVGN